MKKGDIVVVENDNRYWNGAIAKITALSPTMSQHSTYKNLAWYACVLVKSNGKNKSYTAGASIGDWPESKLRLATTDDVAGLTSPEVLCALPVTDGICECPSDKLFNFGCQCGGA
jgi:hypothetical protein